MKRTVAVIFAVAIAATILALAGRAGASGTPTWAVTPDGQHVDGTGVYHLMYKLPAVPTSMQGCYSLKGYRLPSGPPVPPSWVYCYADTVSIDFASSVHGATVSGYWYGGTRSGKITYGAYPVYTTVWS